MLMANKTKVDDKDYLCFTAVAANSTIRLNKVGEPYNISLETSRDKKTWTEYHWTWNDESDHSLGATGDIISLTNAGDKVYWRECTPDDNPDKGKFSYGSDNDNDYYLFALTGSIALSGNLISLLDKTISTNDVVNQAFKSLFRNQSSLVSVSEFNFSDIGDKSFAHCFLSSGIENIELNMNVCRNASMYTMFSSSSNLRKAKVVVNSVQGSSVLSRLFRYCSALSYIEVNFPLWFTNTNVFLDWVQNVSSTGIFVCPAALPTERGANRIPENWTIKKKGYYYNGAFYNDENHTTATVLTAGEYYIDIPTQDEYYYNGSDLILWGGPTS